MLSFEISAIDIVLLVISLILLLLHVTKRIETPKNRAQAIVEKEPKKREAQKETATRQTKPSTKQTDVNFQCSHQFGFLKQLPRNTAVPDECFGCPKVMQCLFTNH